MSNRPTDAGFSLVEALVALGVFAMAGVAMVQLQAHSLQTFTAVETRALADMIAQNELTRIIASDAKPAVGQRDSQEVFAGRTWTVSVAVAATIDATTRRATIVVRQENEETTTATATAFFPTPEAAP